MTKIEFQKIAKQRIEDAKVLLNATRFDAAYYLAGYAVECALKACIAKQFKKNDIPDKKFVSDVFTHSLPVLVELAGLRREKDQIPKGSPAELNWSITVSWSEKARYEFGKSEAQARDFCNAVCDPKNGVYSWITRFW